MTGRGILRNNIWWKSFVGTSITAVSLVAWYRWKLMDLQGKGLLKSDKPMEFSSGTVQIGGPFTLKSHLGGEFSTRTMVQNRLQLIYFGFTHCPDVCPAEMEKITKVLYRLERNWPKVFADVVPMFVTCDPQRDNPGKLREFLKDYHPKIIGLTANSIERIREVAKQFRVFFSVNPTSTASSKDENDYLVDHTTIVYLMDRQGRYLRHFGRNTSIEECVDAIVKAWKNKN